MTYLAPRQGHFAIIVLISFCLHLLFFVVSTEQALQRHHQEAAQKLIVQLSEDVAVPLSANDRVSLAMLAERAVSEPSVAYVGIYDAHEQLIVPMGDELESDGVRQTVTNGSHALGQVVLKTVPVNRASLIGQSWMFVLAVLVLHSLLWLIYGYIARPTNALQQEIARRVRDQLLAQRLLPNDYSSESPINVADDAMPTAKATVDSFLKDKLGKPAANPTNPKQVSAADKTTQAMIVQVAFVDKNGLLEVLSAERREAYFALCDQLLQKTLATLGQSSLGQGIDMTQTQRFDNDGAMIRLDQIHDGALLAQTAAVLIKLIVLVNQAVVAKHRELGYFALPMKAIASDESRVLAAQKLLEKHHDTLVLMSANDVGIIAKTMNVVALSDVAHGGLYERECRRLMAVSESMAQRLIDLRRKVLLLN